MSDLSLREKKFSASVYLRDLRVGAGQTAEAAWGAAANELENYVANCEEALDMLDYEERARLEFDPEALFAASPLSLWIASGGIELRARANARSGYTLSRVKGSMRRGNVRQLLESALRQLREALREAGTHLDA